ncbi:SusD/RagB family nutrient-binding outer membrane lipoprotein [Aureibaculum luteum]|uniref:SusD/RagB family nutrient-binding outer membrane lipoprotein n=1 Tax=Aureibaculum luteum TaxID=1548456 RepID=UPI000E54A901|nr:SusD/RagB family nutrient-binding outer membrane lipoprotein [Aureibaculum luteum]
MKTNIIKLCLLIFVGTLISCTGDFDEINQNPNGFTADDVSAKFFITEPQYKLYAEDRYPYWRAQLIHTDRYAGHFTFGHSGSWWSDGLGYDYSSGYTDAAWGWLSGEFGKIDGFMKLVKSGGEFENEYMYAVGLIMKSLYFQMYTDTWGMVPYSEAGVEGIVTPKYDAQKDIYKGIIADLDAAMATIGDAERTGTGINDLGENDVYCGGDLQKWKKLANTLKLRIGMRALGATGDDFATGAINQALSADLLDATSGSILMDKDEIISQWGSAAYGDVWHNFGGLGSKWTVGKTLIDHLRNYNDPRLSVFAKPVEGGEVTITKPASGETADNFWVRANFLSSIFDAAGATYTRTDAADQVTFNVPAGQYIGQPTRLRGEMSSFANFKFFSTPSDLVIRAKNDGAMYPEIVLTSAEAYFLQAEAAVRGLGTGDAQELLAMGIKEAMKVWGISGGDADTYIAQSAIADISAGTMEQKLEKIAIQRWLNTYTDGFEGWAVVRDTGYPSELATGVNNQVIFADGDLAGQYPQRLRYGTAEQTSNEANYNAAVAAQGEDVQATKLWYAKQ